MHQLHSVLLNNFLETVVRICKEHKRKQRSGHSHKEWYKSYHVADIWAWIFLCWHSTGELKSLGHLKLSPAYLVFYVNYETWALDLHSTQANFENTIPGWNNKFVLCPMLEKGIMKENSKNFKKESELLLIEKGTGFSLATSSVNEVI